VRVRSQANARQILETFDCDMPVTAAIDLVDQCVALFDVSWSVLTITRSTSASVTFRGTPGRSSSHGPSRPFSKRHRRQVRTVSRAIHSRQDTSMIEWPTAHSNTIRDRWAKACGVLRRRTQPSNTAAGRRSETTVKSSDPEDSYRTNAKPQTQVTKLRAVP
jgi:hypothetical protein